MSVLYITEFADVSHIGGGTSSIGAIPITAKQAITTSATAAQSAAFQNNTKVVRLHNDTTAPISVAFGLNPTAITNSDMRMAVNTTEYFDISGVLGDGYKVSAIVST
jgi:hypothetical protein